MKFETLMLHCLSAACLLVCVLTLGSVLATTNAPETATTPVSAVAAVRTAG
jgi:hypothetical protein